MYKEIRSLTLIATIIMFVSGCGNSNNAVEPTLKGSLTGFVRLYNSFDSLMASSSGVNVSIAGANLSATSDSNGQWIIDGVSAGTQTVLFNKQGYGMVEQQGIQFAGGGTDFLPIVYMVQPLTVTVSLNPLTSVTDTDGLDIFFTYNYLQFQGDYGVVGMIALGKNSDVSAADPTENQYTQVIQNPTELNIIYKQDLYAAGFRSGETVYLSANALYLYGASGSDYGGYYSSYLDDATGGTVYTSLGPPSNVLTLKIP
jgi:hypothetical protein